MGRLRVPLSGGLCAESFPISRPVGRPELQDLRTHTHHAGRSISRYIHTHPPRPVPAEIHCLNVFGTWPATLIVGPIYGAIRIPTLVGLPTHPHYLTRQVSFSWTSLSRSSIAFVTWILVLGRVMTITSYGRKGNLASVPQLPAELYEIPDTRDPVRELHPTLNGQGLDGSGGNSTLR